MYHKIVLSAFAKAQTETPGSTKTQWADQLTESLWGDFKYQISRRTLLNYYNHYKSGATDDELSPKPRTIEALCKYLCYPSYAAFLMHQNGLQESSGEKARKITYTLDGEDYREQVTILIHREFRKSLSIA